MEAETLGGLIVRLQAIESDVAALRGTIDAEPLPTSDRQYLSRCFDLLGMEIHAIQQYLSDLGPD